jgi:hypothetical protein
MIFPGIIGKEKLKKYEDWMNLAFGEIGYECPTRLQFFFGYARWQQKN